MIFKHLACDNAHSLTHYQDLSYQIFELEDSGLPKQGILPISARKTITMANRRCLEKDSPHRAIQWFYRAISCHFAHYLSYIKISQTKRLRRLGTAFQISFNCSFRDCAPFCSMCRTFKPYIVRYFPEAKQDPSNMS